MKVFCLAVFAGLLLITGCKKQDLNTPGNDTQLANKQNNADLELLNYYKDLSKQTLQELQQSRASTARYRKIENAFKDGYADIHVRVENMGYHFMKSSLVNASFDVRNPEILVYNKDEAGNYELVAVEYAVPIDATPNAAPEGFTGSADVWERNTTFGLWLCHAWVWKNNPAGAFHDTNPLVQVH
jgi:hypothetical protein